MELKVTFAQNKWSRLLSFTKFYQLKNQTLFHSSTDNFLENLVLEEGSKREINLLKYFESKPKSTLFSIRPQTSLKENKVLSDISSKTSLHDLVSYIEKDSKGEVGVPNNRINFLLVYFSKNGITTGVEAVQLIVKKYNFPHFQLQSEYKHYLAEALWIDGKVEESLKLFLIAYNNTHIRHKVKIMLKCLFPLLITRHSEGTLQKTVSTIEQFSTEKRDLIILASLWKVLFQSNWFSDQQLAQQILKNNNNLLLIIQWMIPTMGKEFLKENNIDDFYRLIELTLDSGLKKIETVLLRLLFDYYYIHQNIERCSAVVKYSMTNNTDSPLTEEQQTRYISLLLKNREPTSSKLNIVKPQHLKYKF